MTRDTDVERLLFEVELQDIYHLATKQDTLPGLFDSLSSKLEQVEGFKAVTKLEDGKVFAVVTDDYRLVTNAEALELGKQCLQQLFGEFNTAKMEVFNIIAPASRSFCHIDLVQTGYEINILAREVWLPYLRVTNSYNRMRVLRFDLGFCRALCQNGVIFESETIPFKFAHTRQKIAPFGTFNVNIEKLKGLESNFRATLAELNAFHVAQADFLPLACLALGLSYDIHADNPERRSSERHRLVEFKQYAYPLADHYAAELKENAYAVFNLVTELASRPVFYPSQILMIDPLQKRAGAWLGSFLREIRRSDFSIGRYLEEAAGWFSEN